MAALGFARRSSRRPRRPLARAPAWPHGIAGWRRAADTSAIVAVAHTILIIVYHLLRNSDTYSDPGPAYFDERDRALLQRLGYALHLEKALQA